MSLLALERCCSRELKMHRMNNYTNSHIIYKAKEQGMGCAQILPCGTSQVTVFESDVVLLKLNLIA